MTTIAAFERQVRHRYASNNGVRIHFAEDGGGPPILFIHGYPDFWMSWWRQMSALAGQYRVAAMELRGYGDSDKPEAQSAYSVEALVGDVEAVLAEMGEKRATIIGHDWGGFLAWQVAMTRPDLVERLGVLSMPHPWAIDRELANTQAQRDASAYTLIFQTPGAEQKVPADRLSFWVQDPELKERQVAAMAKSSMAGMFHYYRNHFPAPPYAERTAEPPKITVPTLVIHGRQDPYALTCGHDGLWRYVDGPIRLEVLPNAGHFLQQDAPHEVTSILSNWLATTR